jgi:hypothetical protein
MQINSLSFFGEMKFKGEVCFSFGISHIFGLFYGNYFEYFLANCSFLHSYDILGAGMLWKPKKARKFVKIC